jgi:hypothetical protein
MDASGADFEDDGRCQSLNDLRNSAIPGPCLVHLRRDSRAVPRESSENFATLGEPGTA